MPFLNAFTLQALGNSMEAHHAAVHAATSQAAVSSGGDGSADPVRSTGAGAISAAPGLTCKTGPQHPESPFPDTLEGYVAKVPD